MMALEMSNGQPGRPTEESVSSRPCFVGAGTMWVLRVGADSVQLRDLAGHVVQVPRRSVLPNPLDPLTRQPVVLPDPLDPLTRQPVVLGDTGG